MQPHPLPASPSTPSPPRRPPAPAPSPTSLDRPFLTGQPGVVTLTFVRHGKQEVPSGSFTPGLWADPPLSEVGKRQAATVGAALAAEPVHAVLCSRLGRAADTPQEAAAPPGLGPMPVPELRGPEPWPVAAGGSFTRSTNCTIGRPSTPHWSPSYRSAPVHGRTGSPIRAVPCGRRAGPRGPGRRL